MNDNKKFISKAGYKQIEDELEYLRNVRRKEVAERILQAKEYGDITDNSEYEDAKNEQAFLEGRIRELEMTLRTSILLEEPSVPSEKITIGSRVRLFNVTTNEIEEYMIVGNVEEVDPHKGNISAQSPLGSLINDKKPEDEVILEAPAGKFHYIIKEILK